MTTTKCFSVGVNTKVGSDTAIFNFISGHECPSFSKGYCQMKKRTHCYAFKGELLRPSHRTRANNQGVLIDTDPMAFVVDLSNLQSKTHKDRVTGKYNEIKYVRFSERGDFRTQKDVDFLSKLANHFPELTFYGYTARKDLDYINIAPNIVINGSGFNLDNNFKVEYNKHKIHKNICLMDCRTCNKCKSSNGKTIWVYRH